MKKAIDWVALAVGLALALFDQLQPLHGLGPADRELLACAALLHDLGLSVELAGHHKHSLRLILHGDLPTLTTAERSVVAHVARYHRKTCPKPTHRAFAALPVEAQERVRRLAAILRVADGLDRAHEHAVARLAAVQAAPGQWTVEVHGPGDLGFAAWGAERKSDLFREAYAAAIQFEPRGDAAS